LEHTPQHRCPGLRGEGLLDVDGPGLKAKLRVSDTLGVLVSVVFQLTRTTVAVGRIDGEPLAVHETAHAVSDHGSTRLEASIPLVQQLLAGLEVPLVRATHVAVNTQGDVRAGEDLGAGASAMWAVTNQRHAFASALSATVRMEKTARLLGLVEHLAGTGGPSRNLLYLHL